MTLNSFKDNFFVITSENIKKVEKKLYGYCVCEERIIDNFDEITEIEGIGAYIFIDVDENTISIKQDYYQSYGLYLYSQENYFAISNSFLTLLEFLQDNHAHITFNKNYADYYLSTPSSSNLPDETLINEIKIIPYNLELIINKSNKQIFYKEIDYEEYTVPINSKRCLEILDEWHEKWTNIIRNIRETSNNISIDLSGGFDSRIVSTIWLSSNIDLKNITINSGMAEKFKEDIEIASMIGKEFDFELNKNKQLNYSINFNAASYLRFGFHKQRYYIQPADEKINFRISGHCGELLRNYPNMNVDEELKKILKTAKRISPELESSTELLLKENYEKIAKKYNITDQNSKDITRLLYKNGRSKIHFGTTFAESYLSNLITIAPLSDPILIKIRPNDFKDELLLVALIMIRFYPKLLDFKFENNRQIHPQTIKFAKEINEIHPITKKQLEFIAGPPIERYDNHENPDSKIAHNKLRNIFNSKDFEMEFEKNYSKQLYNKIWQRKSNNAIYNIIAAIDIVRTLDAINHANYKKSIDFNDWMNNYPSKNKNEDDQIKTSALLTKYSTARIDLKNNNTSKNTIEILENSNKSPNTDFYKWISDEKGKGCIIESNNMNLDLKIKIIENGQLTIKLRGKQIHDKNKTNFPVYIDYTNFKIDNETIIDSNRLVTYKQPFVYKMNVKDSQIINIHIEWLPFSNLSNYDSENIKLKNKIKKLEKENNTLKNELNTIHNSKVWKIIKRL